MHPHWVPGSPLPLLVHSGLMLGQLCPAPKLSQIGAKKGLCFLPVWLGRGEQGGEWRPYPTPIHSSQHSCGGACGRNFSLSLLPGLLGQHSISPQPYPRQLSAQVGSREGSGVEASLLGCTPSALLARSGEDRLMRREHLPPPEMLPSTADRLLPARVISGAEQRWQPSHKCWSVWVGVASVPPCTTNNQAPCTPAQGLPVTGVPHIPLRLEDHHCSNPPAPQVQETLKAEGSLRR